MGLYIVANADGHVISSTDGINWTEPFDTGINIGKAAVGPGRIVYTGCDVEKEMSIQPGLFYTSAWNQTPVLADGTGQYYYNEVHYLGGRFVAVGYENTSPIRPAFAYSEDGVNWTIGDVDLLYVELVGNGNDMQFNDVGYNGVGYFIISKVDGSGLAGGFYTSDLSQGLYEPQWVNIENFPVDANQLVYADWLEGGENFGVWSAFSDDQKTWFSTFNEDPSQPWNFISTGWDLTQILQERTGLGNLNITEATIGVLDGYITWMLGTGGGQIIWWPHAPAGPFVSVPNPYVCSVVSVTSLNPLEVIISGAEMPQNNERITISGATDSTPGSSPGFEELNGVYFAESLGAGSYRLHRNLNMQDVIDATAWIGSYNESSATASLSRGVFIDALGYGDGKFFAGNDDEQVFVCSGTTGTGELIWNKVDDLNDSFVYWNDVDYGDFDGVGSHTYRFSEESPETMPNYRYGGEGNLDTTVYVNEAGQRVSRQRTGYFEIVSSAGRKVVEVYDGETVSDAPEMPSVAPNPTGNANVTDSGSTI